jgi:hypothetical protein
LLLLLLAVVVVVVVVVVVINSRMICGGHVKYMKRIRKIYKILVENLRELELDGRLILKLILKKQDMKVLGWINVTLERSRGWKL